LEVFLSANVEAYKGSKKAKFRVYVSETDDKISMTGLNDGTSIGTVEVQFTDGVATGVFVPAPAKN